MADNIQVSAGTGTTIAADDVGGGVLVQRVKTTWGADGTANDTSAANPMPVVQTGALPAGEAHIGQVGGTSLLATGTMTRTADTNAYAAGDGVTTATSSASAMTVTGAARIAAGSGIIFGGVAEKSTTSTTLASFRIWIYQATPSAIPNDNAAFTAATHADYQKLVATATFDFATGIVGSDGVRVPITLERQNAAFKVASGSDLVVIWEARAAYAPGNAEVFRLGLDISQD